MHEISELSGPIAWHAVLGAVLAALVWSSGLGVVALGRRVLARPLGPVDALLAYPFGLLAVLVAAFLVLVHVVAGVAGGVALAALCVHGVRGRQLFGAAPRAAASAALRAVPFAFGYAVVSGFLLHGASRELDSHALGDNATWVAEAISIRRDLWHLPDLLAFGYTLPRAETASPLVTAALDRALPVDYYLAGATLLPMFLVLSLAAGLGVVRGSQPARFAPAVVLSLLALAAVGYPSWIAESTPVAFALPLALPLFWLATARVTLAPFVVVSAAAALCFATTKIIGGLALAVVATVRFVRLDATASRRRLLVAGLVIVCAVAVAIPFLLSAGWLIERLELRSPPRPVETLRDARDLLDVRTFVTLAPLAQLAGTVCLLAYLVRRREWALLAPLGVTLAAYWLVSGQNFQIALYVTFLLVAVFALARQELRAGPLLAAAGILLGLSAWWFDTAQERGSFAMALLVAAGLLQAVWTTRATQVAMSAVVCASLVAFALAGHVRLAVVALAAAIGLAALWERRPIGARPVALAAAVLAVLAAVDLGLAQHRGTANFGDYDNTVFPREDYAVWREVAHRADDDALVFTSQTGESGSTAEGWNYYPAIGERQVYQAGWLNSALSNNPERLRERLRLNREVLTGSRDPLSIRGAGRFTEYLAVLRRDEQAPPGSRRLYVNRLYALYELPSAAR